MPRSARRKLLLRIISFDLLLRLRCIRTSDAGSGSTARFVTDGTTQKSLVTESWRNVRVGERTPHQRVRVLSWTWLRSAARWHASRNRRFVSAQLRCVQKRRTGDALARVWRAARRRFDLEWPPRSARGDIHEMFNVASESAPFVATNRRRERGFDARGRATPQRARIGTRR
jgi:hypothetical protein